MAPVIFDDAAADGDISRFLVRAANRRPDRDALGVGIFAIGLEHDLPRHFGDVAGVRRQRVAHACPDVQWRGLCFLELGVSDELEVMHTPQYIQLPGLGALRVRDRVVRRRRLGQAREHRGFRHRHVLQGPAEVDLGRRGKAVRPLAEEYLVDVQLEDLVLGQVRLDLPGEQDLAQLARDGLLAGEEEVAGDLHRDGSGALLRPRGDIGQRGADDAQIVHTAVLIETFVFGGQNSLFHDIRDRLDGHDGASFFTEFAQKVAFSRNDAQRHFRLIVGQRLQRRQRGPQQRQHQRSQQGAD